MAQKIEYNPKIIYSFAEYLYQQAESAIWSQAILWTLIVGAAGFTVGLLARDAMVVVGIGGMVLGCVLGVSIGKSKASMLKLQAQQALCQVKIEENTRAAAEGRIAAA